MKFVLTAKGQAQRGFQCCPVAVPRQGCKGRDDRDCALGLCSQAGMVFISRYLTVAAFVSFLTPPDPEATMLPKVPPPSVNIAMWQHVSLSRAHPGEHSPLAQSQRTSLVNIHHELNSPLWAAAQPTPCS